MRLLTTKHRSGCIEPQHSAGRLEDPKASTKRSPCLSSIDGYRKRVAETLRFRVQQSGHIQNGVQEVVPVVELTMLSSAL